MRLKLPILLVLMSFVSSWVRPHPCAAAGAETAPERASASGCHETDEHESSGSGDCDVPCKMACQASLLAAPGQSAAGMLMPALDCQRSPAVRELPLLAHAIDHIPLA